MSGIDRTQILRIDCPPCGGRGYIRTGTEESTCERCGGSGLLEKEVPFKFETNGAHTQEEVAAAFEMPIEEVKDTGHEGQGKEPASPANED